MTKSQTVRAGRVIDAQIHLLDRQILDVDGMPVVALDDLELSNVPFGERLRKGTPAPVIENLLSGPVLGTRIFGGRPPSSRWQRIPWSVLTEIGIALHIDVPADSLDVSWTERWARERIIGRIPGGAHDPE
jgi:hypothetical protein